METNQRVSRESPKEHPRYGPDGMPMLIDLSLSDLPSVHPDIPRLDCASSWQLVGQSDKCGGVNGWL
jgi:hypothetical protein